MVGAAVRVAGGTNASFMHVSDNPFMTVCSPVPQELQNLRLSKSPASATRLISTECSFQAGRGPEISNRTRTRLLSRKKGDPKY